MDWKVTGSPTQLEENGVLVTSALKIAKIMNNFFSDKVKTIRRSKAMVAINMAPCKDIMLNKRCKLSLSFVPVIKVEKLLKGLSNSRSTAIDGLDNYSVKISAPVIAVPLHHLITLSIMQQSVQVSGNMPRYYPCIRSWTLLRNRTTDL